MVAGGVLAEEVGDWRAANSAADDAYGSIVASGWRGGGEGGVWECEAAEDRE